ncbi:uncharacterized protein LOC141655520 [Silene latifolia]|uniref:uncharacterized protein LOC141655520 n=1 Tax=Silene latifolia TaxID=37657 RepID=UPI003D774745
MEDQLLSKTLEDCNFDLDLTIAKLQELRLSQSQPGPTPKTNEIKLGEEDLKWVELFVNEMSKATSVDDAKSRAAIALTARDQEKTGPVKEQNLQLSQENCVLRRLVVAQHERLKALEQTNKKEAEKLTGMLAQCKEELRVSETTNYALKWHLNQARCSSAINTTNFPPDVY